MYASSTKNRYHNDRSSRIEKIKLKKKKKKRKGRRLTGVKSWSLSSPKSFKFETRGLILHQLSTSKKVHKKETIFTNFCNPDSLQENIYYLAPS